MDVASISKVPSAIVDRYIDILLFCVNVAYDIWLSASIVNVAFLGTILFKNISHT